MALVAAVPIFRPTCYTSTSISSRSTAIELDNCTTNTEGSGAFSLLNESNALDSSFVKFATPSPSIRITGPLISILMPLHNAASFLDDMLASLLAQTYPGPMELLVFDDGPSTDNSLHILLRHKPALEARSIRLSIESSPPGSPLRGCGYGRNAAARKAQGTFFCFADADDVMMPTRIEQQLALAKQSDRLLVGSNFTRQPEGATARFSAWANNLSQEQLYTQQLAETTVVTPTWFCSRAAFNACGPFDESGPGTPDDLMFFYKHIAGGGHLAKVEEALVMYRFHSASVTGSRGVDADRIWDVRLDHLEMHVVCHPPWRDGFCIWNAGREGKRLYRSLSPANQLKVTAFCDVDPKKVAHGYYIHMETKRRVPVIHWRQAGPPILICVKRGFGEGDVETNVKSLGLREGIEYAYFC